MQAATLPNRLIWLLLLIAFALRVYQSATFGLYLDEKYTLVISQGVAMEGANQHDVFFTPGKVYFTPREFWKPKTIDDFIEANIRGDIGNSPVYYGVLWVWMQLFGLGDFSVRFLSVLFSTALVGLVYVFVRRHFRSDSLALLSAFLTAIEPFFVAYSHMARNYSMSFLLTLLATHLFLLLVEQLNKGPTNRRLYLAYGLTVAASLLSHYLTITVFLCHGLYVLLFVRPPLRWVGFGLASAFGIGLTALWFVFGGGKYTFQTLAYQAQLYHSISLTNPTSNQFGLVLPATLANVFDRSLPVWADLLIVSNGLGQINLLGIRNMAIAMALGLMAVFILARFVHKQSKTNWFTAMYGLLLVVGLPAFTVPNPQFIVLAAFPSFAYLLMLGIRQQRKTTSVSLLVFMALLATVPTLFLIVMAFKNGHTYGITQRYSGFSFPYAIIFVALLLQQVARLPIVVRLILSGVLLIQSYYIVQLLSRIYTDRDPKYTYFTVPRIANPYELIASRIQDQYTPGDTILYPSFRLVAHDDVEKTFWPYSILDAQLTNLYLPKTADYFQRMDTTDTDRVWLIRPKSKQKIELFNFKGQTFRY